MIDKNIKRLAEEFINTLKKQKVDISKFDKRKWTNGIFKTISRTPISFFYKSKGWKKGSKERSNFRTEIKEYIWENIFISKGVKSYYCVMDDICYKFDVSYGISQKLVSMSLKYLFAYYYSDFANQAWKCHHDWIEINKNCFPIPIDRCVLHQLKKRVKCITSNGNIYNGNIEIPWSKMGKDVYEKLQNEIRKNIPQGIIPLEYEMDELWK